MSGASKFAIAILVTWLAFVGFYFAFHPGGVSGVSSPKDMLVFLISEFQGAAGSTTGTTTPDTTGAIGPQNVGAAPTQTGA
jgi:hypothetical protein